MSGSNQVDSLLMGGKTLAAFDKSKRAGDTVTGYICDELAVFQCTDYITDELEFWDAEKTQPKMQVVVKVQTELRNDEQDDGVRAIYVPGSSGIQRVVKKAVQDAGAKTLEVGGQLSVTFAGTGEPVTLKNGKLGNPPNLWKVAYVKPQTPAAAVLDGGSVPEHEEEPPF